MLKIDLNCDLGESFGNYRCGMDEQVMPFISSANVACGFHASDPMVMARTVEACREKGVRVGAHPGFPDLAGFGRRNMSVSEAEARTMVQYQIGALSAFCKASCVDLQHVKPHGALYNMAARDERLAMAICEGIAQVSQSLILLGLSGSMLLRAAERTGLRCASEVFADRGYEEDGSLARRGTPGAMIEDEDEAIARVISMVRRGTVRTVSGREIPVRADSVCLHGDSPRTVAFAQRISQALTAEGIVIAPLNEVIPIR